MIRWPKKIRDEQQDIDAIRGIDPQAIMGAGSQFGDLQQPPPVQPPGMQAQPPAAAPRPQQVQPMPSAIGAGSAPQMGLGQIGGGYGSMQKAVTGELEDVQDSYDRAGVNNPADDVPDKPPIITDDRNDWAGKGGNVLVQQAGGTGEAQDPSNVRGGRKDLGDPAVPGQEPTKEETDYTTGRSRLDDIYGRIDESTSSEDAALQQLIDEMRKGVGQNDEEARRMEAEATYNQMIEQGKDISAEQGADTAIQAAVEGQARYQRTRSMGDIYKDEQAQRMKEILAAAGLTQQQIDEELKKLGMQTGIASEQYQAGMSQSPDTQKALDDTFGVGAIKTTKDGKEGVERANGTFVAVDDMNPAERKAWRDAQGELNSGIEDKVEQDEELMPHLSGFDPDVSWSTGRGLAIKKKTEEWLKAHPGETPTKRTMREFYIMFGENEPDSWPNDDNITDEFLDEPAW